MRKSREKTVTDAQRSYIASHYTTEVRGSARIIADELGMDYRVVLCELRAMGIYRKYTGKVDTEEYKEGIKQYKRVYKHVLGAMDRGDRFSKSPAEYANEALEAFRSGREYVMPVPLEKRKRWSRDGKEDATDAPRKKAAAKTDSGAAYGAPVTQEDFDRFHSGDEQRKTCPQTLDVPAVSVPAAETPSRRKLFAKSRYHSTPERPGILTHQYMTGRSAGRLYRKLLDECIIRNND